MLYLDTAALVKLIRHEPESARLTEWLNARAGVDFVSSVLSEVELARALRRTEPGLISAVPALMQRIARYEIDEVVRATAAAFPEAGLRSIDAIHLATASAVLVPGLTAFVTYDMRLLEAAEAQGLPTACPGRNRP
ncbi:PIN domain-containing protein [Allosaccharopolyspora coralli]|uniref:Ribonuclease VapC n=1 Tax=Allosaccharopolyspora coralli TaxID=2665642 RepID=A0A5Q3Q7W5_9PSEU|nr:type II toxin-antitoxin system VapC family toxin [Allosaccharopolyspora coralli]QGK69274.1 PIN domain-containing protein [Allosaccharopolyspora coralli]